MSDALSSLNTDRIDMLLQDYESPVGQTLRTKFERYLQNDIKINNYFKNIPGIWECKWYNDSSVQGYNAGDYFWLNIFPKKLFISAYWPNIKSYVDEKASTPLSSYDGTEESYNMYYNALTGYTDANKVTPEDPVFIIGDEKERIQLAVSLYDNNKMPIGDNGYWKKFFVNEEEMYKLFDRYIDEAILSALSDKTKGSYGHHISDYHLSRMTRTEAGTDDFMNQDYSNQITGNNKFVNVTQYFRKPYYLSNEIEYNTAQYCAYRQWSNGTLEHFGIISTSDKRFLSGNYIIIPFEFNLTDGNTVPLIKGELASNGNTILSVDESESHADFKQDDMINMIVEDSNYRDTNGRNYAPAFRTVSGMTASITPVQGEIGLLSSDISSIEREGYLHPESRNPNMNYISNEINWTRTTRTQLVINNTGRNVPKYISYYVTGKFA